MLVIDAMNVIGSRPDGWWRDRPAAIRSLAERLRRLADHDGRPVMMVVDGRPVDGLGEGAHGPLEIRYAAGGRDAADDRIIELLDELPRPVSVVTADRNLQDRAIQRGANIQLPGRLLARLDELGPGVASPPSALD
ncbi:MAG TPA: NYN domain-containing protein [Egibacteraceae bacterium]|nr:NYN domain-containing protein [Egibacteraceae bacterium]